MRLIARLAVAVTLVAAAATPALATTETGHHVEIAINDTENPCQPAVGTAWVNFVYHESMAANGSLHITGTQTGTFLVTDGQGGPEATGHYTVWFGGNVNTNQAGFWLTLRAHGSFEDGTELRFAIVVQERSNGRVNFVQFNCFDGTGVVRVPLG